MNWLMIGIIIVVGIVIIAALLLTAVGVLFCGDVMSFTAPGSETLSPAGAPAGKALVAYNPGISGAAKSAALTIANDLRSRGYTVTLAGVKSPAAANISGYDVIIAGGPMYWGRVSNSIDSYLNGLKPQNGTRLGVFGTTGSDKFNDGDIESFGKQVASIPCSSMLNKPAPIKTIRSGDAGNTDCSELVTAVMQ